MEKIAEYEKCNPEELFTATITDMRRPGPDAEGKTPDRPKKMAVFSPFMSVLAEQCMEAMPLSGR